MAEITNEPGRIERVNRLYAVLSRVNEAIIRIRDQRELFDAACRIAVEDGQFMLAWIGLLEPQTKCIRCVAKYGLDDGYLDNVSISLDETVPEGRGPTGASLREQRPFVNNDTENNPVMAPWRDEQLKRGFRSSASFPLTSEGRTIGVITLYAGRPDYFDEEEVRLLTSLADDFSFALESAEIAQQRAEMTEALRKSHDELEARVQERTATLERLFAERTRQAAYAEALNRINEAVHSTLDFDEIMNRVVVDITGALGVDATVVQVHKGNQWAFAYAHGLTPELRDARLSDDEVPLSMIILETRKPLIVNDAAHDDRVNAPLMERFGITALIGVPLIMRGEVFGVLLADCFGGTGRFTQLDVDFLQKAASTLALALENARLYETERDIADRLQGALLTMPDKVESIEFSYAYHSAAEAARVGGDFYDLFELDEHRVGILIGDVAGKGLDAAVLTSLVKNTIQAHANEKGKTPARVLALANDVVSKSTPSSAFATVFFGILDRRDGKLVYSSAAHTTAAVVRALGDVAELVPTGPLLGAFENVLFGEAETSLNVDDVLFLYTDGLTEARRDREQYGETRVFRLLGSAGRKTPEMLIADVMGDVIAFCGSRLRDDMAMLAVRRVGEASRT